MWFAGSPAALGGHEKPGSASWTLSRPPVPSISPLFDHGPLRRLYPSGQLYVENVPKELYEALRGRARERHRSIASEVLALLEESIPTAKELKARRDLFLRLERNRFKRVRSGAEVPSTEEMQRGDRSR